MDRLAAALVLVLAVASLFGWGVAARRLTRATAGGWAVTVALGLAAVIFVGGVAAVARLAYAPTLWAVVLAGLVPCAWRLLRWRPALPAGAGTRVELALAAVVILAATGFAVATQLPPSAFNLHDDFEKYFAFPVRLLATGTLAGGPLNALGSETLGGLALLHGMVLSAFPIAYINGVDAVFGLFLLLALGAEAGWRRLSPLPGAMLVPLLMALVNPQYVNVSALYCGAALVVAAVLLVAREGEAEPPAAALGLIYAALVALKPTFALFPALHLPLATLALAGGRWRWALRVVLWSALAIAPWVALHLPVWLGALTGAAAAVAPDGGPLRADSAELLSVRPLFYGASFAHYTALAALALAAALWAGALWAGVTGPGGTGASRRPAGGALAGGAAISLAYAASIFGLAPVMSGTATALRYVIPLLLAAPAALVLAATAARPVRWHRWSTAAALVAVAAAFGPTAMERTRQAAKSGNILAFSQAAQSANFLAYSRFALSDTAAQRLRALQAKIPPGEPFVAWIATPFLLDYRRNPIYDVEAGGLAAAWARMPAGARYILWQHKGYAVRSARDYQRKADGPGQRERLMGRKALAFRHRLETLAARSPMVHLDDSFVILRLGPDTPR